MTWPQIAARERNREGATGCVRWFNETKGFGFIEPADGGADVFVHVSAVEAFGRSALTAGERIAYQLSTAHGKTSATHLRVLDGETIFAEQVSLTVPRDRVDHLIRAIQLDGSLLRSVHAQEFEAIVAAIFQSEGYQTEVISRWNEKDGGVDLFAISRNAGGTTTRFAIQCKRWNNKVNAATIRELAGVLDRHRAHQGVVVTTSHFTEEAKAEVESHLWRISLRDYDNIVTAINCMRLIRGQ